MDTLNHYESSIKANEALASINEEYTKAKNAWNENETHRRKLESKFTKMSSSLRDSNLAKDFWQEKLNSSLEDLLVDTKRVAEGGKSSRQVLREKRSISNKGGFNLADLSVKTSICQVALTFRMSQKPLRATMIFLPKSDLEYIAKLESQLYSFVEQQKITSPLIQRRNWIIKHLRKILTNKFSNAKQPHLAPSNQV